MILWQKASEFTVFGLKDIFRCFRDNENLKQPFGRMETLTVSRTYGIEIKASVDSAHSHVLLFTIIFKREAVENIENSVSILRLPKDFRS